MEEKKRIDQTSMTLTEHLDELRRRILYALGGLVAATAGCFVFGKQLLALLKYPYDRVVPYLPDGGSLVVLSATEGLLIYMKVCLIAGLIVSSPWVFYQLWKFVSAGLYDNERRYVTVAVPFSVTLFVGGALFYLFVVSVPMLRFLVEFSNYLGVQTRITLSSHISLMVRMMLAFGLGFQLPVVVALLGWMGLVTPATLNRYRKYVIVGLFVFAALMTSPSPVDQLLLALPMWLLYELGVLMVYLARRKARAEMEEVVEEAGEEAREREEESD